MSRSTFEQLRIPASLVLIILAGFTFLPRSVEEPAAAGVASDQSSSVIVGKPDGAVIPVESSTPIALATIAPTPESTATPDPTPTPAAAAGFEAEVLACGSISGSSCNGELDALPARAGAFTALVRFTDAAAGDTIGVVLAGPGGTIAGAPYTLQGSGDGYYYSQFSVAGLPAGEYTLIATRNGTEVAQTSFRRGG